MKFIPAQYHLSILLIQIIDTSTFHLYLSTSHLYNIGVRTSNWHVTFAALILTRCYIIFNCMTSVSTKLKNVYCILVSAPMKNVSHLRRSYLHSRTKLTSVLVSTYLYIVSSVRHWCQQNSTSFSSVDVHATAQRFHGSPVRHCLRNGKIWSTVACCVGFQTSGDCEE